jgi:hypothetical protein
LHSLVLGSSSSRSRSFHARISHCSRRCPLLILEALAHAHAHFGSSRSSSRSRSFRKLSLTLTLLETDVLTARNVLLCSLARDVLTARDVLLCSFRSKLSMLEARSLALLHTLARSITCATVLTTASDAQ